MTEKIIKENPDSITFGSKTKLGEIKVYGDFNDINAFKTKIDNALKVRTYTIENSEE